MTEWPNPTFYIIFTLGKFEGVVGLFLPVSGEKSDSLHWRGSPQPPIRLAESHRRRVLARLPPNLCFMCARAYLPVRLPATPLPPNPNAEYAAACLPAGARLLSYTQPSLQHGCSILTAFGVTPLLAHPSHHLAIVCAHRVRRRLCGRSWSWTRRSQKPWSGLQSWKPCLTRRVCGARALAHGVWGWEGLLLPCSWHPASLCCVWLIAWATMLVPPCSQLSLL